MQQVRNKKEQWPRSVIKDSIEIQEAVKSCLTVCSMRKAGIEM